MSVIFHDNKPHSALAGLGDGGVYSRRFRSRSSLHRRLLTSRSCGAMQITSCFCRAMTHAISHPSAPQARYVSNRRCSTGVAIAEPAEIQEIFEFPEFTAVNRPIHIKAKPSGCAAPSSATRTLTPTFGHPSPSGRGERGEGWPAAIEPLLSTTERSDIPPMTQMNTDFGKGIWPRRVAKGAKTKAFLFRASCDFLRPFCWFESVFICDICG